MLRCSGNSNSGKVPLGLMGRWEMAVLLEPSES